MKRAKLIILLFPVLMILAITGAYAAMNITVDFPDTYNGAEAETRNRLLNELGKYENLPDLTRGFGNAATYASNAATMRGYQGYNFLCIAVGTMAAAQAPDADIFFYQKVQDQLDDGDVYAGLGANPLVGQVGINMGFIIPDLYLSFKFGKFDYKADAGNMGYDNNLLGVIVDYQLIPSRSILAGILFWKGLNIESGFIYSNNNVVYTQELDSMEFDAGGGVMVNLDPSIDLEMDIESYIIPVEIYSACRLFYVINFGVGIGMDYVYKNSTDLKIRSAGTATIVADPGSKGIIDIDAGTSNKADRYRFKGMVNLGLGFGPVFVDIPINVYLDNGYAVGLSVGIAL